MSRQPGNQNLYSSSPNVKNPGGSGGGGDRGGPICHNCNNPGHIAKNCPRGNSRRPPVGGGGSQKCHNCGETGHIKKDCPQQKQAGQPSSGSRGYPGGFPGGGGNEKHGPIRSFSAISQEKVAEMKKEDNLVSKFSSTERTGVPKPYRPSYGTIGDRVEFQTNYFLVNLPSELVLHRYTITIEPKFNKDGKKLPEPKNKKLKQIIRLLLLHLESVEPKILIVTDFKSNLICSGKISQSSWGPEIKYFHENDQEPGVNPLTYRVRVDEILPSFDVSVLNDFLASTEAVAQYQTRDSMLQILNILLGHHTKSDPATTMVGGNRAFPSTSSAQEKMSLKAGLEAVRGYFLSVRLATFRTVVNVNVSHAAFYKDILLRDMIDQCKHDADRRLSEDGYWVWLEIILKGVKVRTNYLMDASRRSITQVRTIKGFASLNDGGGKGPPPYVELFAAPPYRVWFCFDERKAFGEQKYKLNDERGLIKNKNIRDKYISVGEFFKTKHNVDSDSEGNYPVINFGSREDPIYVPAEACTVEPGQLGKLTSEQADKMIKFAVRAPILNQASIKTSGLPALGLFPEAPEMIRVGVSLTPEMITVCGRMLSLPTVNYKDNAVPRSATGGWNLMNVKFRKPVPKGTDKELKHWGCLVLDDSDRNYPPNTYRSAISDLEANLKACGIETGSAWVDPLVFDKRRQDYIHKETKTTIEAIIKAAHRGKKIDILFIVLPTKDTALYNRIKRHFDQVEGIHTVCVVGKDKNKFYNRQGTYLANVALKFNLKLRGTNHTLNDEDLGIISQGKTMVVGIDVVHPSPGSGKASVASMVASIDKDLAQWPVDLQVQVRKGQEMLDRIYEMLRSRLVLWKKQNHAYPENILVYRDGVSESQYQQVLDDELTDMQRVSASLYDKSDQPRPRFSLIIVGKRHHTRFYPPSGHPQGDDKGNPKRGFVADRGITEARNWDFFLQSHNAIQGTARPAHYYVLWDEIFTNDELKSVHQSFQLGIEPADALERVTHSLCYLFSRAAKAVSIPAPVYYADIACERARRYLADIPTDSESTKTDETKMTDGERAKVCSDLQEKITIHPNLKDDMFYI